jgi:hypothetical protein
MPAGAGYRTTLTVPSWDQPRPPVKVVTEVAGQDALGEHDGRHHEVVVPFTLHPRFHQRIQVPIPACDWPRKAS